MDAVATNITWKADHMNLMRYISQNSYWNVIQHSGNASAMSTRMHWLLWEMEKTMVMMQCGKKHAWKWGAKRNAYVTMMKRIGNPQIYVRKEYNMKWSAQNVEEHIAIQEQEMSCSQFAPGINVFAAAEMRIWDLKNSEKYEALSLSANKLADDSAFSVLSNLSQTCASPPWYQWLQENDFLLVREKLTYTKKRHIITP